MIAAANESPDLTGRGMPETVWAAAGLPGGLPELGLGWLLPGKGDLVVVAPHPDDEILGIGGTLSLLFKAGVTIRIVSVTDGEASHPGRADELRDTRRAEQRAALRRIGLTGVTTHLLRLPDGGVDSAELARWLRRLVGPDDVVLAPWDRDGHPDHDACGRAAATLANEVFSYLVWAWHWADPDDLPRGRCAKVSLPQHVLAAKRDAAAAFISQIVGPEPILPPWVLDRLLRPAEVLLRPLPEGADS